MVNKNLGLINATFSFLIIVVLAVACESPTVEEETRALLKSGTWSVHSVEMNGIDKTEMFAGMKLNIQDNLYAAENGDVMWGTDLTLSWWFDDETARSLSLGSGLRIYIHELNKSSLKVRAHWNLNAHGGGAVAPESGYYDFEFKK